MLRSYSKKCVKINIFHDLSHKSTSAVIRFFDMLPIRNISYLSPMCWKFWEKCINSHKIDYGCSTPLTLKEPGGGICPPRHLLLYLSRLLFVRAEISWLFFFKSCAQFKTIFFLIGPRVMMRRCVIERWVQRKTDQKLIFKGNYTQIVFFVFRIHFHYVLSYLFGLFGVRTCVSILWHTSLPKNATLLEKIGEK